MEVERSTSNRQTPQEAHLDFKPNRFNNLSDVETAAQEAKPHLEGLSSELILLIVRKMRLSDLVTLSIASLPIQRIISAPASGMLSTQAVIYWYWGPEDRRLTFAETERNMVRFAPFKSELKRILDHLCMYLVVHLSA
ncbi:MAG: hypothetical protein Q9217_001447 [Psora testacea]